MFSSEKNDNTIAVIRKTLYHYKVKVTCGTIIEYLKSYPADISLKSVCDFFDSINVSNYALKIEKSDLISLIEPFIAHIEERRGKLFLVYSINSERVTYADSSLGRKTISTNLFLKKWGGVIIIIEPTEFSGEADYSEKRKDEIVKSSILPSVILVITLTAISGIIINNPFTLIFFGIKPILLLVAHITGLTFSLLLFGKELNLRTKFTDKLCHLGSNIDCDAITNSRVSKVFGLITWADIGVVFFSGGLLALFLFPIGNSIGLLTLLSIAAIPYPIFSIFYQWLKLKKWCVFCLSVQLILITEFLLLLHHFSAIELSIPVLFQASLVF